MNQSFITISDIPEDVLQIGLMEFANLYATFDFVQQIQLLREKGSLNYLVYFVNEPDFDHFSFAVNYLHYIEANNGKRPVVNGYFKVDRTPGLNFLHGKVVKLYVSKNDNKYDNVNVVNSDNETYLFDFGGSQVKLPTIEKSFEVPQIDINNYNHLITIIPAPVKAKPWWKFW